MALSENDVKRLNESMPVANDLKLGDLLAKLEASSGATVEVKWADVTGKPSTFPPSSHTHTIANVTGLQTALDGKLTASKAATQANSTATDVAGLVTDFNALIAKLKAAGLMA
ncbi:head fiber protein [Bacillus inaquosorum]|uniref:head fiber protein n=1 Tax=Bacillus inaquosorum TaxID=483913 RepID=UPI002EBE023B|nr:head fiber protein [Bacillus inaquosorum]